MNTTPFPDETHPDRRNRTPAAPPTATASTAPENPAGCAALDDSAGAHGPAQDVQAQAEGSTKSDQSTEAVPNARGAPAPDDHAASAPDQRAVTVSDGLVVAGRAVTDAVERKAVANPGDLQWDAVRLARVTLMRVADAGDAVMGRLVAAYGPEGALGQVRRGHLDPSFVEELTRERGRTPDIARMLSGWRARLLVADPVADLTEGQDLGARLIVPGDLEWPTQLDDLGPEKPFGLWLHGDADLRFSCLRSVAVVGSRAATPYGTHVAAEFGADLSEGGWTVISGGAHGVDAAAHRGALAGEARTIAVLACGTDIAYPAANQDLFAAIRARGVVVSESPMGVRPTRLRFLVRNRLIAALSRGTVVVEAAVRSGALNTASHAVALRRHLAAVPGPVTSENSTGCHRLIRRAEAVCVTSAREVIELVGAIGDDLAPEPRGPVLARDALDEDTRKVLEAVPARGGTGPATIALDAGLDLMTTLACLGGLAAAGYVERAPRGWRLRRSTPAP
ncbi:DNA-processing protein DprA [Sphaerisporangium sp. NPDC051011]|uniref:DNA-processing protein DprA n=1 Tax=Sphaerisporangium sp. NPDC051011 TaxID=3155792 RepID=UPI0033C07FF0